MRVLSAIALLLVGAVAHAAAPAGIALNPITVSLDAQRPADAVTLTNGTGDNKVIQAEVMRWTRERGEDHYAPAPEMLVSPPMFRVAAGGQQIVRVGLKSRAQADSPVEKAYRLFLQEVPETAPSPAPAGDAAGGSALRLLLRFGVPVFLKPAKPQPTSLAWQARQQPDGGVALSVRNDGNRHVKLANVQLTQGAQAVNADGFAYVFAGETYTWMLKPAKSLAAGAGTLSASTDDGPVHAGLVLQGP
ncbi:MAG: molecular chaperone [Nevskiaceae bacterium]|nr:MAG: molecular chaperone [Nevskiaceae bacterium]